MYRHQKTVLGIEPLLSLQKLTEASNQQAGTHQEHQRESDLSRHKACPKPVLGPVSSNTLSSGPKGRSGVTAGGLKGRDQPGHQTRHHPGPQSKGQNPTVERHLREPGNSPGGHGREKIHAPDRQTESQPCTQEGHQERLGEALPNQPSLRSPRCSTDGRLPDPARSPGQKEVGQIHAGDHEEEAHSPEKYPEGPPCLGIRHPLAGRPNGDPDPLQFIGEGFLQAPGHTLQVRSAAF